MNSQECKHDFYVLCNKETCDGVAFAHEFHCKECGEPSTEHINPSPQGVSEEWEKEFDEKFDNEDFPWADIGTIKPVKDYIHQLLSSQRTELLKSIEGIRKRFKCGACDGAKCGHTLGCQALSTILNLIKQRR